MKKNGIKRLDKIAVVGMANIFPKALDSKQFLDNIIHKKNCIITVPENRWPGQVNDFISNENLPDKAVSRKAGLIEDFNFNPENFLVDQDLLSMLDPVHQIVLQAGRDAFSQCYHTKEDKKRTGVILAAIALPTDTSSRLSKQIICNNTDITPKDFSTAGVVSLPASILARALGFEAGCFTLDAACASSLYSIKLACEQLHLKKADIMVTGGVSRPDSLYTQIGFTQLQALSPSGRCSPFDKNADGLVVGEGAGIIILKRLEDAIECGDKIHAVITGTGVSNDIEGTLVSPAFEGQIRAMTMAYDKASWSPDDIQYMECHGSGTPVGDNIELLSIKALLDKFDCQDKHLAIGSVKSMMGHLLTAAGAAGFIKTILAMNEGLLPPSLNYSNAPLKSPLNSSNIKVQTKVDEWNPAISHSGQTLTRKAGISAFGFGGINAHILVEEFKKSSTKHFIKNREQQELRGLRELREPVIKEKLRKVPCAIVGMGTIIKKCDSLSQFKDLIFGKTKLHPEKPGSRWKKTQLENQLKTKLETQLETKLENQLENRSKTIKEKIGFYINNINCEPGEFHIPPNQINDILPQHIILLKAVKQALKDAKISSRPEKNEPQRDDMGCAIGIEFDYGATNFHLRWTTNHLDEKSKDEISPPLTFNRTLGALGGIVASRVAREFKLGGPCFTLSAGSANGIKAVETGVNSLSSYETNLFICGCVDLAGDIRQFALNDMAKDQTNDILPSEGAGAIILKRLDQAIEDDDKIYGVITGIAGTCGSAIPGEKPDGLKPDNLKLDDLKPNDLTTDEKLYARSLENALKDANTNFNDIDFYEACNSGIKEDEKIEANVLNSLSYNHRSCKITSTSPVIGNTRGASAIFSIIKTALLLKFNKPATDKTYNKACVASISMDGAFSHIVLQKLHTKQELHTKQKLHTKQGLHTKQKLHTKQELHTKQVLPNLKIDTDLNPILNPIFNADLIAKGSLATSSAHEKFLEFSNKNMQIYEHQFKTLTQLAGKVVQTSDEQIETDYINFEPEPKLKPDAEPKPETESEPEPEPESKPDLNLKKSLPAPLLNREQCLEYAIGKAGNVLGKDFEIIDTYPVRVRLPAEPLMLVDRIMDIQGEKLSLTCGKIITQHDVKNNCWYLDGGKAPVSITIEAGQADLFLSAWLGIDHAVKGTRKYRLLDAKVTFHRTLPEPGETIEYHIEIDRFLKQGDVYLFFFHYKGYINDQLLISMKDGCAGFFTEQEVKDSNGIILKPEDLKQPENLKSPKNLKPISAELINTELINTELINTEPINTELVDTKPIDTEPIDTNSAFTPLVPVKKTDLSDEKTQALRKGDLNKAFGENFKNIKLGENLRLPGKRMHLIDRILEFNPKGGRFGIGSIIAEADINGDEWFLKCHFIDDMVMPGTLMYECCAHALRIFTQRMGWISDQDDISYDVVLNNKSDLKCRGPVTTKTKKVRYEIEIKEMGYNPEPYVIADAHMFSDDLRIVLYKNMGLKISGLTKNSLISFWRKK